MKYLIRLLREAKVYRLWLGVATFSLLALTGLNLLAPWLVRHLVQVMEGGLDAGSWNTVLAIAAGLAASYLGRGVFRFLNNYLGHLAAWNLVADMRVKLYEHLQKLSLRFYHDKQTGQLMSRTTNDTATFEVLIAHAVPDLASNVLVLLGVTVLLFIMNPVLAGFTLIPVPLLVAGSLLFAKKIRPRMRQAQGTLAYLNATLQDNLSGMKEIQVFNQEHHERGRVHHHARTYADAILGALRNSAIFHPSVEALSSMGTAIVVLAGGWLAMEGRVDLADMVGFILYLGLFYQPITTLARVTEDLQQALAGAERVFEILDTESDVQDLPGAVARGRSQGDLEFRRVGFSYHQGIPVLQDISFHLEPGKMLALVGPTGVGKSTLVSLITRFYDPGAGQILLDGQDIRELTLASLRQQISMVLQDVFLFSGTVAENIAYGRKDAHPEEIIQAATVARAHGFIADLPEGYDTQIGERGLRLSGGQKQRLAIARAVLRDSPILILDEATASVDVETEAQIQAAIQEIAGSRTIIVIAHRLSTVQRADTILMLEGGRITEAGTHRELLAAGGSYKRMCDVQFRGLSQVPVAGTGLEF